MVLKVQIKKATKKQLEEARKILEKKKPQVAKPK